MASLYNVDVANWITVNVVDPLYFLDPDPFEKKHGSLKIGSGSFGEKQGFLKSGSGSVKWSLKICSGTYLIQNTGYCTIRCVGWNKTN